MPRSLRNKVIICLVMFLFLLLAGCSPTTGDGINENGTDYDGDDDNNAPRTFVFSDQYPYSGKKEDSLIGDKMPNVSHTVYIYVINNGESWNDNEIRNIKISYYDISRQGKIKTIDSNQIHVLKGGKKNELTYIRVDNIIYPQDARGYLLVEGEIEQGKNKWYQKRIGSNQYNYGNPPPDIPLVNKDNIVYHKEIVE